MEDLKCTCPSCGHVWTKDNHEPCKGKKCPSCDHIIGDKKYLCESCKEVVSDSQQFCNHCGSKFLFDSEQKQFL